MKNTLIITLCLMTGLSWLAACSTDDIDKWDNKGFVWFTEENVDFSFRMYPEIGEGESFLVPVPITVASTVADRDRIVEVEVVREPQDSRTRYEIQNPVVFRAGHITDTMYVKVENSSHLYKTHDTITFKALPSADFNIGIPEKLTTNLCLYNGLPRPKWWDANDWSTNWIMGQFTQLKMEIYIIVTGGMDDPTMGGGWWNNNAVTMTLYKLNEYVKKNDIRYPDDDPFAPGKQPYFGNNSY